MSKIGRNEVSEKLFQTKSAGQKLVNWVHLKVYSEQTAHPEKNSKQSWMEAIWMG